MLLLKKERNLISLPVPDCVSTYLTSHNVILISYLKQIRASFELLWTTNKKENLFRMLTVSVFY